MTAWVSDTLLGCDRTGCPMNEADYCCHTEGVPENPYDFFLELFMCVPGTDECQRQETALVEEELNPFPRVAGLSY